MPHSPTEAGELTPSPKADYERQDDIMEVDEDSLNIKPPQVKKSHKHKHKHKDHKRGRHHRKEGPTTHPLIDLTSDHSAITDRSRERTSSNQSREERRDRKHRPHRDDRAAQRDERVPPRDQRPFDERAPARDERRRDAGGRSDSRTHRDARENIDRIRSHREAGDRSREYDSRPNQSSRDQQNLSVRPSDRDRKVPSPYDRRLTDDVSRRKEGRSDVSHSDMSRKRSRSPVDRRREVETTDRKRQENRPSDRKSDSSTMKKSESSSRLTDSTSRSSSSRKSDRKDESKQNTESSQKVTESEQEEAESSEGEEEESGSGEEESGDEEEEESSSGDEEDESGEAETGSEIDEESGSEEAESEEEEDDSESNDEDRVKEKRKVKNGSHSTKGKSKFESESEEEDAAHDSPNQNGSTGSTDEEGIEMAASPEMSDPPTPPPKLPPYFPALQGCRSVDDFRHLNRIEEGTYGVVFRAEDLKMKEIVALKRLKMEKEKEGFPITSLREINTLLKVQHENIVTVREIVVGSNMDKIYLVMDFVEHDLKALMESMKTPFTIGQTKTLLLQLLKAVAHMHDNWILHRDLKSSNLLLSHKGILKVGDFGLAREYGDPLKPYTPVVVTLWYRAPELLLGTKMYSTAIDVWSVGTIFAEMLLMKPLWPGKNEIDEINKIFKDMGTPTEKIWPGVGELPAMKKCTFSEYPYNTLKNRFAAGVLDEVGYDLLNKLLTYDPERRVTAEDAKHHEYFDQHPLPIDPSMFPTWPARSEQPRGKRDKTPKPPSGGAAFKSMMADDAGFQIAAANPAGGFNLRF